MPEQLGIAMVGARDSILGFRALGLDVFPVATGQEAEQAFSECVRRGYAAIFVTEGFAEAVAPQMKALSAEPLPAAVCPTPDYIRPFYVLDDPALSRVHLLILEIDGALHAVDASSKNGTWAGGERIRTRRLAPGTRLALAGTATVEWRAFH